jgi:2-polyprenyl-3-methyl-5-hydroxy-6-metoxy-1,4-benzoquinol methylase
MDCCSRHVASAQRCFGWMSKLSERRYRRKGLDENQRQIVETLESLGLDGVSLLEVGCGVGILHQTLLEKGAATALGVDLAPRMLEFAEKRADERQLGLRTEYRAGDFVELSDSVETADITVMDKVVCCYPAPKELIGAAIACTRGVIALTYPRKHFISELSNRLWNFGFWLFGSDFRGFVHDPQFVQQSIEALGFHRVFNRDSRMWHTQVYVAD